MRRSTLNTPVETARLLTDANAAKARLPIPKLFVLAILGGAFIALAGLAAALSSAAISNASASRLINACIFPAGLIMLIISGGELFTGNCMMIMPLLDRKVGIGLVLRNWLFVYIGNFVGSILVALLVSGSQLFGLLGGAFGASVISTAATKCSLPFAQAFLRGIGCNFLVCTAVCLANASKSAGGKILGIFFPVMAFVAAGFEHSIANMYYISAGMLAKLADPATAAAAGAAINWSNFLLGNLLPVTLGNMVGGVFLGACLWYARLHQSARVPAA